MHTHAKQIVRAFVQQHLSVIHAARRELLCAVVSAVMAGHLLSLSRLARALMGQSTQRAALKRVDRLIGNARIGQEAEAVAAALLCRWCRSGQPVVIAVDWSEVAPGGAFVELRAALTPLGMGRGLTIYQEVYPRSKLSNGQAEGALLKRLARVDTGWRASDHYHRCGVSPTVVCRSRASGLGMDRAHSRWRVCLARRGVLGGGKAMVREDYAQSDTLE